MSENADIRVTLPHCVKDLMLNYKPFAIQHQIFYTVCTKTAVPVLSDIVVLAID